MKTDGAYHTVRILRREDLQPGFTLFWLEGAGLTYRSGQYITLVQFAGDEEVRRSYSFISSPELGEPMCIGVRRVDNGLFSRQLVDKGVPGDEWLTTGTGGRFVIPKESAGIKKLFFFAAGAGITPIYSIIKTALHQHAHLQLILIYSSPAPERTLFLQELLLLQQQHAFRFEILFFFSNAVRLDEARLNREHVQGIVDRFAGDHSTALYYVCGPEAYMRMCTYALQERGIDPALIRREDFYATMRRPVLPQPPDRETHQVHIALKDVTYTVPVVYPQSILQAARAKGIVLPYSCEAGRCGNCIARCMQGTTWHGYNEVLTAAELEEGFILTCTGHPVGGDITIAFE